MIRHFEERFLASSDESLNVRTESLEHAFAMFEQNVREKEWMAMPEISEYYLKATNIHPIYRHPEDREKLNTRPGIVISNHPGYVDTPIIVSMMQRPDVKIMSGEGFYDSLHEAMENKLGKAFTDQFFSKHLVTRLTRVMKQRNLSEVRQVIEGVCQHIDQGGIFFVYPTGGGVAERKGERNSRHVPFKPIFRMVLEKLKPEDMVYSIQVNPEDVLEIAGTADRLERLAGFSTNFFLGDPKNVRPFNEPARIRVEERYSQVSEWMDAMEVERQKGFKDKVLTDHFWGQFKDEGEVG